MHILVVDDSALMRRYVARTLQMMDPEIEVMEAENGAVALSAAGRLPPDLIITDLNMPVMNGKEMIAQLTRNPALASTPVLILSADHSEAHLAQMMGAGAAGFLTKPVTPEQLRKRLTEIFEAETAIPAVRKMPGAMPAIV